MALANLMEDRGAQYQICGPSAFNFHGLDEQVPQITYAYNNRISGERRVGNLRFSLIKVSDARLGSTTTLELREGVRILYCSKARTLMDAVYSTPDLTCFLAPMSGLRLRSGKTRSLRGS